MNPETGEPCPPGVFDAAGRLLNGAAAIGELVGIGSGGFTGYWKNPEADAERYSDGRYRSGDLFSADADAFEPTEQQLSACMTKSTSSPGKT